MYKQLQNTLNYVSKFSSLHNVDIEFSITTVGDLRGENGDQPQLWTQFEKNAGVYVLFGIDGRETLYIGKSDTDLGGRVHPMIYKSHHTVSSDIKSNDIILIASLKQFPYLASALETHLIREISPKLNKTLNKRGKNA